MASRKKPQRPSNDPLAAEGGGKAEDGARNASASEETGTDQAASEQIAADEAGLDPTMIAPDDASEKSGRPEAGSDDAMVASGDHSAKLRPAETFSHSPYDHAPSGVEPTASAMSPPEESEPPDLTTPAIGAPDDGGASSQPVSRDVVVERRGGFVPLVLGGIVAAGIGFGAAYALNGEIPGFNASNDNAERFEAQDQAIADLKASIPAAADLTPLESSVEANAQGIAELNSQFETRLTEMNTRLDEMTARMVELEKAPVRETVSQSAIEAYETELDRLRVAMQTQREEVEGMVNKAQQLKAEASEQTADTQARAALVTILSALDSGASYAGPLEELEASGQTVPEALQENVEGVATLADLRKDFPTAARQAIAVTRGSGNSSVGDFFKTQLGIRSLAPKEGNDPDAILSRAEAALADGDLSGTLTEIEALPPSAKAELSDWVSDARTRLTTVEAANGLMAELNTN